MILLVTAILASATTAPAYATINASPLLARERHANHACPPVSRYQARARSGRPLLHHLDELLPADAFEAVYRTVDNCVAPIIVRYGVGSR